MCWRKNEKRGTGEGLRDADGPRQVYEDTLADCTVDDQPIVALSAQVRSDLDFKLVHDRPGFAEQRTPKVSLVAFPKKMNDFKRDSRIVMATGRECCQLRSSVRGYRRGRGQEEAESTLESMSLNDPGMRALHNSAAEFGYYHWKGCPAFYLLSPPIGSKRPVKEISKDVISLSRQRAS
jgi:hypothetical protein